MNMAEDFGDSTGSGLVNTAKQAAKEVVQAVVTKGAETRDKIVHDAFVTGSRTVVSFISVCQHRSKGFFSHIFDGRKTTII